MYERWVVYSMGAGLVILAALCGVLAAEVTSLRETCIFDDTSGPNVIELGNGV